MNHDRYRTIFNQRLGMLVPAAEITTTQGMSSGAATEGSETGSDGSVLRCDQPRLDR